MHGRVVRRLEVPCAPGDEDVEVRGDDPELPQDRLVVVGASQWCEQDRVLEREVVLRVEVDRLEAWRQLVGRLPDALEPMRVEGEVVLNERGECRAVDEPELGLVVADPAVEFGTDEVEVAGLGASFAFADALCVLTA